MLLPLAGVAAVGVAGMVSTARSLDGVARTTNEKLLPLEELEATIRTAQALAFGALLNPPQAAEFRTRANGISAAFDALAAADLGTARSPVEQARAAWNEAFAVASRVHRKAGGKPVSATSPLFVELVPFGRDSGRAANLLGDAQDLVSAEIAREHAGADSVRNRSLLAIGGACLLGSLIALFAARRLARAILGPLAVLRDAAARFGIGHLAHRVEITSGDELQTLGESFNTMAADLERGQLELAYHASHDPLTGLGNRNLLLERLGERLRPGAPPSPSGFPVLLLADLDDFKRLNDVAGHLAGDQVLVEVAERVRGCLGRHDLAARLGGDEFAILLDEVPGFTEAATAAECVLAALRKPFSLGAHDISLECSIGIAPVSAASSPAEVLRNADLAMYAAKSAGRNRYTLFEPQMHADMTQRLEIESDLRRAIEHGMIVPHYQPIIDMATGRVRGIEALARWHHTVKGALPPGGFIPFAEESGLVVPLGWIMLQQACADLVRLRRDLGGAAPDYVSVNLSASALHSHGSVDEIRRALSREGLEPEALVIEITETAMMRTGLGAHTVLADLHEMGVRIAIDDFGTGYSSLAYLAQFPVSILKIDKAFVDEVGQADNGAALAEVIIALGRALNLEIVAEGVETAEQTAMLLSLGCAGAQGYHFAHPVEADRIADVLRSLQRAPVNH